MRWLSLIFRNGEALGRDSSGPFNDDFIASWRSAIRYLRRFSSSEALATFRGAMEATGVVNVAAQVVSLERQAAEKPESNYQRIFEPGDLESAKASWVAQMKLAARDIAATLTNDNLVSNLYDWMHCANVDEPRAWTVSVITDYPKAIPKVLTRFLSVGSLQGFGDYVAKKTETFRRQYFDELLPVDSLVANIERLDTRGLDAEDQRILALFLDHVRKWNETPNDTSETETDD